MKLYVFLLITKCTLLTKFRHGLHGTFKNQSLCLNEEHWQSQGTWPVRKKELSLLQYLNTESFPYCVPDNHSNVSCTHMIWYVKSQANYISTPDLIWMQNPCLFFCSLHPFPIFFPCFPDELLHSSTANSSMQLACPSRIPLVHCLLPEHNPRTCLVVSLVAWRLFQSLRGWCDCLT